jgi:hypothetical protein
MAKVNGGIGAVAVILVTVGGCTLPEQFGLNFLQRSGPAHDRVVALSLDTVSQSTKAGLEHLGFAVVATPQGDDLRLSARTDAGDELAVILTRVKTDTGERTRVRIEGGTSSHHQNVLGILADLELSQKR